MRYLFFFLFLCLLLPEGRKLAAQNKPEKIADKHYRLTGAKMSEDGKWLIVRKSYNVSTTDTVLIFDHQLPEKPVAYRTKISATFFLGNDHLLLQSMQKAELLNLKDLTSIYFKGVKRVQVLKRTKHFLLHYNPEEHNRLELRDNNNGHLLNTLNDVKNFYVTDDDDIYALSEEENKKSEIVVIRGEIKEKVYNTSGRIDYLEVDPTGQGIMVYRQNPEGTSQSIVYLDLNTRTNYSLNDVLPITVRNGFREVIREGNAYFLQLLIKMEYPDDTIADIWYGHDNQLEEKFYPPFKTSTYVWEPRNHFIRQIGTEHLATNMNIGNERYFLSFNPYLLQDYSLEQALLQMQVYDRGLNRYSIMDTIAPALYLSENGEYALSKKNQAWHLYHIPSGSKKAIDPAKELGTPWFTDDGNAILFEGEGALWKYDLQAGTMTQTAIFKGYQIRVINGETDGIPTTKGRFRRKQVNLAEPLVIKLYNAQENVTSYVLWYNGESNTIVAPTTRHIQSLSYNRTYTHFNYIEEDYNMPPRFVYKEIGEDEKIVFESNKEDKIILSLQQEIISYTNSDGIPLKGILYYPLNYTPSGKYPMVVHIYERQRHLSNRYPYPSYYDGLGFNIRLLIENGYFVYLPDIVIQGKDGPGMDALDCVHNGLDALAGNPLIDTHRIGLIGHSFGGYEVNFIATRSTRFAAYVSGSGHSDIVWAYHAFNYNFHFPDYVRIEANMYKMGITFSYNKTLYFENNPIYSAENVNAPVLLWTGLEDQNVTCDHSMAFYNALRRNKKNVIALFYKGEGHALQKNEAQIDLTSKIQDWFDYFLKDEKRIEWIGME